ncbi:MAG: glycoside hydrolase family 18 protein [Rhodothermales bacterium]
MAALRSQASPAAHRVSSRLLALAVLTIIAGCSGESTVVGPEPEPEPEPVVCTTTFQPKSFARHVIGFYPSWRHGSWPISEIRWDKLTRVIYAFAFPTPDGGLDTGDLMQIDPLVAAAHARGVEVYLSIGGGGGSDTFPVMAANAEARTRFAQTIRDYLGAHCLDGVDIDWERWTKDSNNIPLASEKASLVALLHDLRNALHPVGLKISVDVFATHWIGQHYDDAVHPLVDYVHVMAYNFSGPWSAPGPHSSFLQAVGTGSGSTATGLAYWTRFRNWPKEKIILGVPFYGRDFDTNGGAGITYADIVARHVGASNLDRVANIYYNGVPTITAKTQFVVDNGYPGVMIWEIGQDVRDPAASLLHAIAGVANP